MAPSWSVIEVTRACIAFIPYTLGRNTTPEDALTAGPTASKHPIRLKRKMDLLISCELMISDIVTECTRRTDMIKGNPNSTIFPNPTSTCLTAVMDLSTSCAVLRISGLTPDLIRGVLSPTPIALLTSCRGGLSFLNENPRPGSSLGDMIITAVGRLFNPALAGRRWFIADRSFEGLARTGPSWDRWEKELVAGERRGRDCPSTPREASSSSPIDPKDIGEETNGSLNRIGVSVSSSEEEVVRSCRIEAPASRGGSRSRH